jgi:hypothetical protein
VHTQRCPCTPLMTVASLLAICPSVLCQAIARGAASYRIFLRDHKVGWARCVCPAVSNETALLCLVFEGPSLFPRWPQTNAFTAVEYALPCALPYIDGHSLWRGMVGHGDRVVEACHVCGCVCECVWLCVGCETINPIISDSHTPPCLSLHTAIASDFDDAVMDITFMLNSCWPR